MMTLAQLIEHYQPELERRHGAQLTAVHHAALNAIRTCHTRARGELDYRCEACRATRIAYPSCGNRACPACQHSTNNQWLDRQRQKLLPVTYYLVTFTLPAALRGFARTHPEWTYDALFRVATKTLQTFGQNDPALAADFLWLLLQHVLPKGFHRVRDYGLLHGNAHRLRQRVQLLLNTAVPEHGHQPYAPPCR